MLQTSTTRVSSLLNEMKESVSHMSFSFFDTYNAVLQYIYQSTFYIWYLSKLFFHHEMVFDHY
jgi:hypothetical protein